MTKAQGTFHTVIFGSGLAGLSCARKLALAGKKVCLIEKSKHIGGHLPSFHRKGVNFEVGIHYIASTDAENLFGKAVQELGISPEYISLNSSFERLQNASHDCDFTIEANFAAYISSLTERFPTHAKALRRFERDANLLWNLANQLEFPLTNTALVKAVLKSSGKWPLIALAFQSLHHYLKHTLKLPHDLIEIISVQHTLLGVPPKKLSAVIYLLVHRYYFEGPCFPKGGGKAFASSLLHNDVHYITGDDARFESCKNIPGARFRITTSQGEIFAQNVVWTPDPHLLALSSNVSVGFWKRQQLKRVTYPHGLVVGYFATRRPLEDLGMSNANHWLMGNLDSNACYNNSCYDNNSLTELAHNAPVYLSTGSLRDPCAITPNNAMGAKGVFQAMFVVPTNSGLWGVPHSQKYRMPESHGGYSSAYAEAKAGVLEILKARIAKDFPLVKEALCHAELGTPLTHERYLFSPARNGYGFGPTVADFLLWRPSYKTSTPGLYLCGAHIKPAHGIATALLNGVGLAKRLLKGEPS
jgi:all-trans-retinol 13,14-reductase